MEDRNCRETIQERRCKRMCNYRGINLLSNLAKFFSTIILGRLQTALDPHLLGQQHGFWPKQACCDMIFTLRMILDESTDGDNACPTLRRLQENV